MTRLLLGTMNPGKQAELRRLLAGLDADVVTPVQVGLSLEVDEPFESYAENAVTKALAYADASGLVALADDSGIEVAALDWGPGVRSARWASGRGADRLLEALDGVTDRRARMVCVVAVARPGSQLAEVETFTGIVDGEVATERRGSGGFGYDPVFLLPSGQTTAELPQNEKDRISHRGQAVSAALARITALVGESTPVP